MRGLLILVGLIWVVCVDRCWCQSLARQAGYLYLSPLPQASYVSAQNRYILVRFVNVAPSAVVNLATDFITVTGASSGPHPGKTRIAGDGRTVIFEMAADFSPNELVTVDLDPALQVGATGQAGPFEFQFMTTAPMPGSLPLVVASPRVADETGAATEEKPISHRFSARAGEQGLVRKAMVMPNGVSVPSDFPKVLITVNTNPSPGYLFLENGLDGVPPYTMMLDNNGLPVWYRQGRMYDFKIQKNGMITWTLADDTGFCAFDQNFTYLKTYLTTNGYLTDSHELKILADGSYYLLGYRTNLVDMSHYLVDGLTAAIVRETVVQGFTAYDELIFQWRAWDNYNIQDLAGNTDFPHLNALDIDDDGNILVSARHLSEVTKINRDSGEVIWRLSGAHSSFSFVNDPLNGTSFQHNITALGNGHYLLFDNGNGHTPQLSRAVEYQLDLTNKSATLVWQFRDNPDKYANWLGSAQRLPSGNTLINFVLAKYPKAIEVDSNGVKRFELSLATNSDSYRAFRLPWNGVQAAPYLVVEPQPENLTLLFNKFGDTHIAHYRIYGGTSPHPTNLWAQSVSTLAQFTNLQHRLYYFRVTSVNTGGVESPFSNEENVQLNITQPGRNQVQNGDFSQGSNSWSFVVTGSASGAWTVTNNSSQFYIANGGPSLGGIQLLQGNMALIQNAQYVLDFDAWSDQTRYIQVQLVPNSLPLADYSALTPTFLTPNRTHYRYVFTMRQPSDFSANLLFNLGSSSASVFLARISLFRAAAGDLNFDGRVDALDLDIFCRNWLKQPGLSGDLDGNGRVDFNDLTILGQNWGVGTP